MVDFHNNSLFQNNQNRNNQTTPPAFPQNQMPGGPFVYDTARKTTIQVTPKPKPHPCNFCDKAFSRKDKLKSHIANVHLQGKPLICNHCSFHTTQREAMKQHLTTVYTDY